MKELLKQIRDNNILLDVVEGKLKVFAGETDIHPGLLAEIKERKDELLQFLSENDQAVIVTEFAQQIPVAPVRECYPLSSAQRRLWMACQVSLGSLAYHMTKSYTLEGALNENAFINAFEQLIRRHESLRTVFKENEEDEISQWILARENLGFSLMQQDLRERPQQDLLLTELIQQHWTESFNLFTGPLIRAGLFRLSDNIWVFSYVMHHIIGDGWSMDVILKELLLLYKAACSMQPDGLEPLRIQYKDYTAWQQLQLTSEAFQQHRSYWLHQFSGDLPVLEIPVSKPRPAIRNFKGGIVKAVFNEALTSSLKLLVREEGCSIFMGLLSGVYTLLYRYTSQQDIIVGSPIAGREHIDLEDQIGFYVNTLALRCRFNGMDDFKTLLRMVRQVTLEAYEHQAYPFDELVADLDLQRDLSRNVLFDVMVALQNATDNSIQDGSGEDVSVYKYEAVTPATSKFDLCFVFIESGDELEVNIEYNTAIFDHCFIERMSGHLQRLLEVVMSKPSSPILYLDYLGGSEKHQILELFNDIEVGYPQDKTIIELFEEQVAKTPDHIAVEFEATRLTYAELNETANKLGNFLRTGYLIQPDDLVAIQLPRSEWMVIAMLGVLKSGGAYMPVDPDYPQERITYMIEDSRCKVLLNEAELLRFKEKAETYDGSNLIQVNKPADLAYVIYTSGTTGKPKGSLIEHRNVVRLFKTQKPLFDFTSNDVWTMFHSFCFDFSVWEMYGALFFGGKLIVIPAMVAKDPEAFVNVLNKSGVTILNQTPSSFYNLISYEKETGKPVLQLRYIIFGGEALSPAKLEDWHKRYPATRLINMYGITETTVHVTYKEITDEEIRLNSNNIGKPIPSLTCYVLDRCCNLLPPGIPGELFVGGAGVSRGYLNRSELTAERFIANPFREGEKLYRSGDLARILENGDIEYLGRIDSQVKIRGHRIEPAEIENVLQQVPGIETAIVVPKPGLYGEKELIAYILGTAGVTKGIRSQLVKELPAYMIPAYFVQVDAFPVTLNGKIDKKRLPDPEELIMPVNNEHVPPRNELEHTLVTITEEVIGRKGIGIKDNFFAAGGDSIKAITFVVRIKKRLGYKIGIKHLYDYPVIEELSDYLVGLNGKNAGSDVYEYLALGHTEIARIKTLVEEEEQDQLKKVLPAGYEDIYPIVPIEQGMIFSSLMNPRDPVYYDQFSFIIRIADIELFKEGLYRLLHRHPILRTRYYLRSFSRPVKIVMPEMELPLTMEDLSAITGEEKVQRIKKYVEDDLGVRLTFDDEILWRINLFKLGDDKYYVTYSFHHAMLDGWSISVIKTEIANYNGKEWPSLKHSYKDYCALSLGRQRAPGTEDWWKHLLQGYTRNKLPFNYKSVPIKEEYGMKKVQQTIDGKLLQQLNRLAVDHELSFKAICLAAHVCLLHIICGEQDVVTGVVTHERPEIEDGENILGCFLTTVPVRINFDQSTTLLSLLKQVNDYLIAVKQYEVHLSDIARYIGDRTSFGNPVFDTILNYTDFHRFEDVNENALIDLLEAGQNVSELDVSHEMTNTLFDVEVGKTLDKFSARIKYTPAYFNEEEVQYALALYIRILGAFAEHIHTPVASLNVLSPQETKEVLTDFNDTYLPYAKEMTLDKLFEAQVKKTPDAIALKQDGITLSYNELNERANQLTAYLLAKGVKAGDNIGLHASRNFNMIIGMYGILKAGAAYVPIDPEYPADRQEYIIRNSAVTTVVADTPFLTGGAPDGITVITMNEEDLSSFDRADHGIQHSSLDLAYTIYTSGSTGRPKGVMIEHHSVINLIEWVNETFTVDTNDRLLFITSMCFDLSVYDIFGMLAAGGTIIIGRNEEVQQVEKLKKLLKEERITFWDSVPTTMNYLIGELEAGKDDFLQHDLRLVFLSGDWIPVHLPDRIRKWFPKAKVISLGGATEGTVWSNYYPVDIIQPEWSSIPYGKPIKNNTFYILNDNLQPVPKGVAGELYIGGAGVARGYANDPEKTASSFKPDPFYIHAGARMYKTGDLGRMMPDGNMEFLGRKDNQVKIRGFRVELGEIESVLQKHEKVKGAIVDVYKGANDMNQLCAYLIPEQELTISEIKEYLAGKLPGYMVPASYMILGSFPLNSNGKINRKSLPKPAENGNNSLSLYMPPVTATQKAVAEIWKAILHIQRIGIRDDLFELGANSLSVGAFVNRVQRDLNLVLNIREVFTHPTIEAIAEEIEKIKWTNGELFNADNTGDTENFSI
jgi:amino acid adenylation domain-containing protein